MKRFRQFLSAIGLKTGWRPVLLKVLTVITVSVVSTHVRATGEVHMPTGEYRETVDDLRVKVRGGFLVISRSWRAVNLNQSLYRWDLNPAWTDLEFELDVIDGTPKTITRAESQFERNAGGDTYVYHSWYFIKALKDAAGATTGWRWYDRHGNWVLYDAAGKIASYGDRNDTIVTFERDANGHISRLLDANGSLAVSYDYDGGNVSAVHDRTGRSVQYHYTGGNLTEVIDVLGNAWNYAYSGATLTGITDPEGHATTITYNANRAVRVRDAEGHETNYDYDYDKVARVYTVVQRSPENRRTERHYNADGDMILERVGDRTTMTLQQDGSNVDVVGNERGLRTRYEYDSAHNLTKVAWPNGTSITRSYESTFSNLSGVLDERATRTTFDYDAKGNCLHRTEAVGTPEERTTDFNYDGKGQMVAASIKAATSTEDVTTLFTYDSYGNIQSITDGENRTTIFEYDALGNVTAVKDAASKRWEIARDLNGSVVSQKTPLAHETKYEYDRIGNVSKVTDPNGRQTKYVYDGVKNLTMVIDPLGGTSKAAYGADGELLSESDQVESALTYGYDAYARINSISDSVGNKIALEYGDVSSGLAGLVTAALFPTYREEYRYDNRNRIVELVRIISGAQGHADQRLVSLMAYDATGNLVTETDALGHPTLYTYDRRGRISAVADANGAATRFTYYSNDSLRLVTDASGHHRSYLYDRAYQLRSETQGEVNVTTYDYDQIGNAVSRTYANGDRITRRYDADGRAIEEMKYAAGATESSQTITFEYDAANLLVSYVQHGDAESSASYVYDQLNKRTHEVVNYGMGGSSISLESQYSYRPNGQKSSFTYSDGTQVVYDYSANNVLERATATNGVAVHWMNFQWNEPNKVTMPGVVRRLTYDGLGRPTAIASQSIGTGTADNPLGPVLMDFRYAYDGVDNVLERMTEDGVYQYAYDPNDRLIEAVPPVSLQQNPANPMSGKLPVEGYTYDAVGNRLTSLTHPGAWIYDGDNRLLSYGIGASRISFTYDENGNIRSETLGDGAPPARIYSYYPDQRLKTTSGLQGDSAYMYDPFGRMIHSSSPGGNTWYQYSDEGLVAEFDESGTAGTEYGWRPDRPWGTDPLWLGTKSGSSWSISYFQNDHIHTPQSLTSDTGTLTWRGITEAFGRTYANVQSIKSRLRFPGQIENEVLGVSYNLFRNYSFETGRYTQSDPIDLSAGINPYVYSLNNPLKYSDPSGLKVDANYFNPTDPKSQIYYYAQRVPDSLDFFVVGGHGSAQNFVDSNGRQISPTELADNIRNSPNYLDGMPVKLYSCNTGSGPNSYAQQLANALGVTVFGPNNFVWYSSKGGISVSGRKPNPMVPNPKDPGHWLPDPSQPGKFTPFLPSKKRDVHTMH